MKTADNNERTRIILLLGGVAGPLLFTFADIYAGLQNPDYSFTAQAISELFAIGAPMTYFVVPIFTLGSILALAFSLGVWRSAGGSRAIRLAAVMFVGNAINGFLLWNIYPMHMRGEEAGFTDVMHVLLSGVGVVFILSAVIIVTAASHGWLRYYSIIELLVLMVPSAIVFMTIPGLAMGEPTPFVGLTERISTYGYYVWQFIFVRYLINQGKRQK
jgi:hypothetical protein